MEKQGKNHYNELDLEQISNVSGGYVGSDKYNQSEYNKYGISHQHNIWSKDKYWLNGKEISQ